MDKKFENIEDIIAKFLAGEAVPEEIALFEEWKKLNPENEREFSQFEKLFIESSSLKDIVNVDTDAAWTRMRNSLHNPESKKGKVISINGRKQVSTFIRIAAAILLVAGLGIAAYFLIDHTDSNYAHLDTTDSVKVFNLPDGSSLTLNQNSSISYKAGLFSKKRIVKLKGEAFFKVVHDSLSPFIVEAGGLEIKDIGTSFNVNAIPGSNTVIVTVFEGEVQLTTAINNSVFVSAGEEATYDMLTSSIIMSEKIDKNIAAYKDKVFIFENAELTAVIKVLNDIYNVKLELESEELQHCRITVSFNNEQIDIIADVIAETLGLSLKKDNDKIIFSGNGCK